MWRRSFVAATVALGGTVDDALVALGDSEGPQGSSLGPDEREWITQLRAPQRNARALALATAVRDVVLAIDEATLR
jgi:hypothetical protein